MPDQHASGLDLLTALSSIGDPRVERTRFHKLEDILAISMCATLCGADSFTDFALFGRMKEGWLPGFLELPGGIPSHDTFRRVISMLDPASFVEAFVRWTAGVRGRCGDGVVAIDGKALRGALEAGGSIPVVVGAFAVQSGLCLGQLKVDEKSNEITAVPELLELLVLKGCVVTLDAMGCQKGVAEKIREGEADYVLALKGNHPTAYAEVSGYLDAAAEGGWEWLSYAEEERTRSHGRVEKRRCWQGGELGWMSGKGGWKDLRSVVLVESERQEAGKEPSVERRYFLSSLEPDAGRALAAVRSHWAIENSLHWVLDVAFDEDRNRARDRNAAENLSGLRRWAINAIKSEPSNADASLKARRKIAGWDEGYLTKLFSSNLDA